MTLDNLLVKCTRCGNNDVPKPTSIEVDPICAPCMTAIRGYQFTDSCPGWGTGEDCGNPPLDGGDLCGDCHGARLDYESPLPGNPRRYPG